MTPREILSAFFNTLVSLGGRRISSECSTGGVPHLTLIMHLRMTEVLPREEKPKAYTAFCKDFHTFVCI